MSLTWQERCLCPSQGSLALSFHWLEISAFCWCTPQDTAEMVHELGLCHPSGRPELSSWLLASVFNSHTNVKKVISWFFYNINVYFYFEIITLIEGIILCMWLLPTRIYYMFNDLMVRNIRQWSLVTSLVFLIYSNFLKSTSWWMFLPSIFTFWNLLFGFSHF